MNARQALIERGRERQAEAGQAAYELGSRDALAAALGWSDFVYRRLLSLGPGPAGALLDASREPLVRRFPSGYYEVHDALALIALREMTGLQTIRESLLSLSRLAQSTVRRALTDVPGDGSLIVFGLGKLGGRELNFYSDLDLVFAYAGTGEREERLALRQARLLLERLEGGFRIDLRLRPFGRSGPLAMGLEAMDAYFQNHGRDWERYAWLKARTVAGRLAEGRDFLRQLRPFIYRRYLDYNAIEALREMKRQIEVEAGARADDVKQGPGGIREIEFIVQAFQLVRGGREPALAGCGLRGALAAAKRLGHLEPGSAEALLAAYDFLRRVENRLQMASLAPVHALPEEPERRELLAASLGFGAADEFLRALTKHQERVREIFNDILGAPPRDGRGRGAAERLWRGENRVQAATELGLDAAVEALVNFQDSRPVRLMGPRGRRALDRLAPELIGAAAKQADPDAALRRLLGLLTALVRRSAYLALLVERVPASARLVALIGSSPWIAERLAATPAALDELLDERVSAPATRGTVARQLQALPELTLSGEEAAEQLREFNELQRLKIAAAVVEGDCRAAQSERSLTQLAEYSVRAALRLATARVRERHGDLEGEVLAIGYGKLGSRELGFASDLDLVFVYTSAQKESSEGLATETYLARLTQRTLSLLSQPTMAGPLYTVDTRLRPEGAAGLLLSRFDAWLRYQSESAWLWERQALLRARPVAGSARLARRFNAARQRLLVREAPGAQLAADIVAMRQRVAEAGPRRTANSAALIDGEFLAAYWLLSIAPRDPGVIRHTDLERQMHALAQSGHVASAPRLADALSGLRTAANRRVLGLKPDIDAEARARRHIEACWDAAFPAATS